MWRITHEQIDAYREKLEVAIRDKGGTPADLKLIKEPTIRNAIRQNRPPEEVAEAILA